MTEPLFTGHEGGFIPRECCEGSDPEHCAIPAPAAPITLLTFEAQAEVVAALSKAENDPIVPPKMKRKVWKEMMRIHFTVRRPTVKSCGHKINITSDPRNNCSDCWFAYFQNNKSMTQIADECFTEAGRDVLERSRGKKFTRMFIRFMSTIARFQREAAAAEAEKEATNEIESTGRDNVTDGASGGGSPSTDTSIGGLAGEARSIGGISEGSDASVSAEEPFYDSPTEEFGTSLSTV